MDRWTDRQTDRQTDRWTDRQTETKARLREDASDRNNLRIALSTCVDVLDTAKHPECGLINIYSGHIVDDSAVNVHNALEVGTKEWKVFEQKWPDDFHSTIHMRVKLLSSVTETKSKTQNAAKNIDAEFIYARAFGILATSRGGISLETLFSRELALHSTALFDNNGDMRSTSKSVLKSSIQILSGTRTLHPPTVIIVGGCALLWTAPWPSSPARVSDFISAAVTCFMRHTESCPAVHVVFDRYNELSTKSCCRLARQKGNSRVYTLKEDTPLPKQSLVLDVTANKQQIIQLIVNRMSGMEKPPGTRLIVNGPDPRPIHVGKGCQQTAVHHEEADVLMAYHMIQEAVTGEKFIRVLSDDTDVLVILAHHLHSRTNDIPEDVVLTMASCSASTSVICVNEVVRAHSEILPNLLAGHALTGCDTVSSFCGIGKATVLKKLKAFKGLLKLGELSVPMDDILKSCLEFTTMLYNQDLGNTLNNMRAEIFKRKIAGKRHVAPKLCNLPPTMSSFEAHCKRAHFQAAMWKAAGSPTTPDITPLDLGWEVC